MLNQLAVGWPLSRERARRFTRFTSPRRERNVRRNERNTEIRGSHVRRAATIIGFRVCVSRTSRIYFRPVVGGRTNLNSTGRGTSVPCGCSLNWSLDLGESRETVSLAAVTTRTLLRLFDRTELCSFPNDFRKIRRLTLFRFDSQKFRKLNRQTAFFPPVALCVSNLKKEDSARRKREGREEERRKTKRSNVETHIASSRGWMDI